MDEYLWPETGATPIVGDAADWEHNAWLPDRPNWVVYRSGYLTALDLLVEHVQKTQSDQDFLIYPIVFLARHATELGLKHITLLGAQLLDQSPPKMGHHRLPELWTGAQNLMMQIEPTPSQQDLLALDEAIDWFSKMDASSFVFRYPYARDQTTPSFELDESVLSRLVNIREFNTWVRRIQNFLDGGIEMYLVQLGHRQEDARQNHP